jgi:hypothetical protein
MKQYLFEGLDPSLREGLGDDTVLVGAPDLALLPALLATSALAGIVIITSSWALGFVAVAAYSPLAVVVLAPLARREWAAAPSEPHVDCEHDVLPSIRLP